ncbi:hypothetical protein TWF481_011612 [Arthrobotrys musiformis]|uniref:N-acetyltransferase domain-containing protein n=1 Tax=Arthrobotrys musiformis TaxID=47236 RepID=A0AAV9VYZ5_9PEZI
MTLRPATPADLPPILLLTAPALENYTLATFTHPFRHLHPASFTAHASLSPTKKLLHPGTNGYNLVTTKDGIITSWAFWRHPQPTDNTTKEPQKEDEKEEESPLLYPSLSPARLSLTTSHTTLTKSTIKEPHTYLSALFVHPSHKRNHLGSLQTLWGLFHSAKKNLPVYLLASAEGELLYRSLGFKVIAEQSFPSIHEMPEEDLRREIEILGKEVVESQFSDLAKPKLMRWEGTVDDEIFQDPEVMAKILSVSPSDF